MSGRRYACGGLFRYAACHAHDAVAGDRVAEEAAAGRGDDDVLPAVASLVRDRCCLRGARKLERPSLFARLRVERAEAPVVGRADEDEASGRGDRAAVAGTSGVLLVRREAFSDAEWHTPRELARVDVDGSQLSPWRLLAEELLRVAALDAEASAAGNPLVRPVRIHTIALAFGARR